MRTATAASSKNSPKSATKKSALESDTRTCEACRARNARPTHGWYRGFVVYLCARCEKESESETSKYVVRLSWADNELSYMVVRELRSDSDD